jgi:hypothetical protein
MTLHTNPFKALDGVAQSEPPPLERESPHRALSKANKRHAQLTEALRQLRSDWAAKNIRAQQLKIAIATSEITHVEKRRRELHLALESTQAEIGRLNKEIKEKKAASKQSPRQLHEQTPAVRKKKMPFADDPVFPSYFILAAKEELDSKLYAQVERLALSLMHDAYKNGIDL